MSLSPSTFSKSSVGGSLCLHSYLVPVVTVVPWQGGLFWIVVPLTMPGDFDLVLRERELKGLQGAEERVRAAKEQGTS